ncbi:MAG: trehalose 6-phosphate synthase [Frankiales bacterium]|jgi:trehalose 6-phosphate synthase|nr:trehalose 6-phosphate synthase [Frankiales bacterium]
MSTPTSGGASVLVASNRGPISFSVTDAGQLVADRGGGGLVSGLSAVTRHGETLWVCAALSDADRRATANAPRGRLDHHGYDTGGIDVRMLNIDTQTFKRAYNGIANSTLWFIHHHLYDTPNKPHFDGRWRRDWEGYRSYDEAFARALAEEAAPEATAIVQDYHLTLTPRMLREKRPDLRIGHFSHTPWAAVDYFRMLPDDIAREVLLGVLGADHVGFLSPRWAGSFLECCAEFVGGRVDPGAMTVEVDGHVTNVGVHPLGIDADFLRERAAQPDVEARRSALLELAGDRKILLRIDRTELSKNIVRGLAAYRELLRTRPEWKGRVTHFSFSYPSRHDLPEYREYTAAVQRIAAEIEDEFGTDDWTPLHLSVNDDFARSLAAYRIADVLVVNPIRDGMNLVAKEGPVLSERGLALVLSREAGAATDLADDALLVNPFDVSATAEAMHTALSMSSEERTARARGLAASSTALPPSQWFADQIDALRA